mmetsp:Transcript_30681/g.22753  ORF Transcript_30681/g.22753 Transcript_30681/m.22753 type:complete len:146 (+) Transcript_30681:526-963(+)
MPGGDILTFYVPNNFAVNVKQDKMTKQTRAAKNNKKESQQDGHINLAGGNVKVMKSLEFTRFQKYLSKRRVRNEVGPNVKKLLQCKEYLQCEARRTVNVEIREWFIPIGNKEEDGLKLLIFIVSKNHAEKRLELESGEEEKRQPN